MIRTQTFAQHSGVEQFGSSLGSRATNAPAPSTKLKGDVAEQTAILEALKRGWGVSVPVGDRHPYDLLFDIDGVLVKIQVKSAWLDQKSGNYIVDNRRTKTNRRVMVRDSYRPQDFDFAILYLEDKEIFYVFPVDVFIQYAGPIHLVENERRQRKPLSASYRNAWHLILQWAARGESRA